MLMGKASLRGSLMIATPKPQPDDAWKGRPRDIIDAAIRLFNQHGVGRTSTNRIADSMGISSGNLHYHFRSKNDLLMAIYGVIERDLTEVLTFEDAEMTAERAFAMQMRLFTTLWRYRFFFGSIDVVLTRSAPLYENFVDFQLWLLARIGDMLKQAVEWGFIKPIELPNTPELFAANSWVLWLGWVRWEMITLAHQGKHADEETPAVILRIIRRHLSFQGPYYTQEFALSLAALLEREAQRLGISPL
jgi:AcrR family transcriptional regulator